MPVSDKLIAVASDAVAVAGLSDATGRVCHGCPGRGLRPISAGAVAVVRAAETEGLAQAEIDNPQQVPSAMWPPSSPHSERWRRTLL